MKKMNVPRGTARAKRRQSIPMAAPSAEALRAMATDAAKLVRKMARKLGMSIVKQPGTSKRTANA